MYECPIVGPKQKKRNTRDEGNQEDWSAIGHGSGVFMCVWGRDQAEKPLFTAE